jgi:hypothetical protein
MACSPAIRKTAHTLGSNFYAGPDDRITFAFRNPWIEIVPSGTATLPSIGRSGKIGHLQTEAGLRG